MTDISVVIGFQNWGLRRLQLAASSVSQSFGRFDGEVIISDYGSENHEANQAMAQEHGFGYVLTSGDTVWSRSRALNAGFAIATGQVLVSTDADMIFSPGAFERIYEFYLQKPESAFFLQCRDLPEGMDDEWVATHSNAWQEMEAASRIRPRWGMGGMMAISREGFDKIRGFDNRLHTYGGEDLDFAQRARRAGYRTFWVDDPKVRMYHMWHPSTRAVAEKVEASRKAIEFNKNVVYHDKTWLRNVLESQVVGLSNDAPPIVTVAIATRNRAEMISDTIMSILNQSVQDFEIVVVDDGGTDNLREVLEAFADERIRYIWQPAAGISAARNHAAKISRGTYTAIIDDDDLMHPERLRWHLEALEPGQVGNVGAFINFDNATGQLHQIMGYIPTVESTINAGSAPGHGTWFLETEVIRKIGYDESLSSGIDNQFMLRLLRSGARVGHTGKPVLLRRIHPKQVTATDGPNQIETAEGALSFIRWGMGQDTLDNVSKFVELNPRYPVASFDEPLEVLLPYLPDHLVSRAITVHGQGLALSQENTWDGQLVVSDIDLTELFSSDTHDAEPGEAITQLAIIVDASYRDMVQARKLGIDYAITGKPRVDESSTTVGDSSLQASGELADRNSQQDVAGATAELVFNAASGLALEAGMGPAEFLVAIPSDSCEGADSKEGWKFDVVNEENLPNFMQQSANSAIFIGHRFLGE